MNRDNRPLIEGKTLIQAVDDVLNELYGRLAMKGYGFFASIHEISGVIDEEVREFKDEVHADDHNRIIEELKDIAVGAIFSIACIEAKTIDW